MQKSLAEIDSVILTTLKNDEGYTSGEGLAQKLGVSRQALWKHIGNLTDKGYEIVAVPHLGYKLISSPDKFYPWEVKHNLKTRFIANEVYYQDSLPSTQDYIWQLGLKGAKEGQVVFAETQNRGRGRMQRQWLSPRGGIYFSLLLKPEFLPLNDIPKINLLISLACLKAIERITGIKCRLKWPNDIYLKDKKLAGILCEVNAEADKVHFVVIGVGVNVNSKDLPRGAVSLFLEAKKIFSRLQITKAILEEIEKYYLKAKAKGFSKILKEWQNHCYLWGKKVRVKIFDKLIEAEAIGIDKNGYLILKKENGQEEKISAGDIIKA
ncbi:MAG: biotin--[acetyl-CoA-carboxylase] ligase [Candidatus Omnitrophica bacterium]|nr:biotin--[acetyl-CoA-carboxylase] ligase [Candidatus Omnitrophota bacterium]